MRRVHTISILLVATVTLAQDSYFPKNVFSDDPRLNQAYSNWYSHALKSLEERPILDKAADHSIETYRFLWLRSFRYPISVRLELKADGAGVVTATTGSGSAGFPHTVKGVIDRVSRPVTPDEVRSFLGRVRELDFWSVPSCIKHDQTGTDGSEWIIEAAKDGKYHVVARWSPYERTPPSKRAVRELGLALVLDIAKLKIPEEEIY